MYMMSLLLLLQAVLPLTTGRILRNFSCLHNECTKTDFQIRGICLIPLGMGLPTWIPKWIPITLINDDLLKRVHCTHTALNHEGAMLPPICLNWPLTPLIATNQIWLIFQFRYMPKYRKWVVIPYLLHNLILKYKWNHLQLPLPTPTLNHSIPLKHSLQHAGPTNANVGAIRILVAPKSYTQPSSQYHFSLPTWGL